VAPDRRLSSLDPKFYPHACEFLARLTEAGIPVMIVSTRRTLAEHAENLARGVSWSPHSKHCLTPDHRVLTSDLVWTPGGDVGPGTSLLSFDDYVRGMPGNRRSYRHASVVAAEPASADVYRVVTEDGESFQATQDHRWLVDSGCGFMWVTTTQLRRGPTIYSRLVKMLDVFDGLSSFDAGWLAGFLDGEGHVGCDGAVTFAQRPGHALDKAIGIIKALGFRASVNIYAQGGLGRGDCVTVRITGNWNDRLSFLGSVRPVRLLPQFLKVRHRVQGTQRKKVVAVERVGRRDIVRIQTSTRTFIADGFAMHNCDGLALDVCLIAGFAGTSPRLTWDGSDPRWSKLGAIARECGLVWGGDWTVRDLGHVEYVSGDTAKGEPA
jgi:hypothetical protein